MNFRKTKRILIALEHGAHLNGRELAEILGVTLEQIGAAMVLLRANGRIYNVVKPTLHRVPVYAITPFGVESLHTKLKCNRLSIKQLEAPKQSAISIVQQAMRNSPVSVWALGSQA